jgi:hypothetical protein
MFGKLVTIDDKAISQLKALSGPGALDSARDAFVAEGKSSTALAMKAETAANREPDRLHQCCQSARRDRSGVRSRRFQIGRSSLQR